MNRISIKSGNRTVVFPMGDIIWVKGENNYSTIYIGDQKFLVSKSLKRVETRLNSDDFIRISKNALININRLIQFKRESDKDIYAYLQGDVKVKCSKNYRRELSLIEL